ncbi:MAG: MFS transporter [bacterium]
MSSRPDLAAAPGWRARLSDPMLAAVCALGITQITGWGTSYYCLGVLAGPIAEDTGWSRSLIYFGFTAALLAMGLVSTWVGRAIDRYGARSVMSLGTLLVSAGLYLLAQVRGEQAYLAAWVFLGLGMRLCLYDAAMAALVQVVPSRGRRAISYLTLFGAFASSVFWVIGHYLNEAVGWRTTLEIFSLINLVVCLRAQARPRTTVRPSRAGCARSPSGCSRSSCHSTPMSSAWSRSSSCRCSRLPGWRRRRRSGSPR